MTGRVSTLVVDNDEESRQFLRGTLQRSGYEVSVSSSGEEALDRLRDSPFELVITDLELGGKVDGLRVLQAVKWRWPKTAVVILTANGSLETAMAAIREHADGYLLKPTEEGDIRQIAREALAQQRDRCCVEAKRSVLSWNGLMLDPEGREVALAGRPVDLTPGEFRLLRHLMQNAHHLVPVQELAAATRGQKCESEQEARRVVRWFVHHLRRKLEPDPSHPHYIHNVHGMGYTFGVVGDEGD